MLLGRFSTAALEGNALALSLESLRSDETLDLGGLGVVALSFPGDGTADDEFSDIVLLVQAEELADLGGTLGSKALGVDDVGEAGYFPFTLLDDAEGQDGEVETSDGYKKEKRYTINIPGGLWWELEGGFPGNCNITYHHGHSYASSHRFGGGGSSCGHRQGGVWYGLGGGLYVILR